MRKLFLYLTHNYFYLACTFNNIQYIIGYGKYLFLIKAVRIFDISLKGDAYMKKAVIVYNSEPILGNFIPSLIRMDGNVNKYLKTIKEEIDKNGLNCEVRLDDTVGDVSQLISQDYELLICLPGSQKRLLYETQDIEKMLFLNSLEFHSNDTDRVIQQMKAYK